MIHVVARHKRVLLFALVGVINTCVDVIIFFCLVTVFKVDLLLANCIAFGCAVCLSYFLNRYITFANHGLYQKNALLNLMVYLCISLMALGGSSYVLLAISSHGSLVAGKLSGTMISFAVNYIGIKTLVFKSIK